MVLRLLAVCSPASAPPPPPQGPRRRRRRPPLAPLVAGAAIPALRAARQPCLRRPASRSASARMRQVAPLDPDPGSRRGADEPQPQPPIARRTSLQSRWRRRAGRRRAAAVAAAATRHRSRSRHGSADGRRLQRASSTPLLGPPRCAAARRQRRRRRRRARRRACRRRRRCARRRAASARRPPLGALPQTEFMKALSRPASAAVLPTPRPLGAARPATSRAGAAVVSGGRDAAAAAERDPGRRWFSRVLRRTQRFVRGGGDDAAAGCARASRHSRARARRAPLRTPTMARGAERATGRALLDAAARADVAVAAGARRRRGTEETVKERAEAGARDDRRLAEPAEAAAVEGGARPAAARLG